MPKNWPKPKYSVIELCNFLYLLSFPLLIITYWHGSFLSHLYLCFLLRHVLSEEIMQRLLFFLSPGCTLFGKTEGPALLEKLNGPSHTQNLRVFFHLWETGRQKATANPLCISLVAVRLLLINYFKKKKKDNKKMACCMTQMKGNKEKVFSNQLF